MHTATQPAVEALVSYITPGAGKPFAYEYDPPAGVPRRSAAHRDFRVQFRNARELKDAPTLDVQGFELRPHATRVADFYDPDEVRRVYYPEVDRLVKEATGATSVLIFDQTVRRSDAPDASGNGAKEPVSRVHNDYTAQSALRRVRDLVPAAESERLLRHRIMEINVWRPIRGPLQTMPLGLLDARSLGPGDLVACDLIYPDRRGEIYYVAHRPQHAWYYYPDMGRDEALLLKCFDSDESVTRFGAHAAFRHPAAPAGAAPRESIEVRTFAFFAPPAAQHSWQFLVSLR